MLTGFLLGLLGFFLDSGEGVVLGGGRGTAIVFATVVFCKVTISRPINLLKIIVGTHGCYAWGY